MALDGARQRMQRQYGELPDDVIEDMIETVPRNADGKIGVDEIADFIDDKNTDYCSPTRPSKRSKRLALR